MTYRKKNKANETIIIKLTHIKCCAALLLRHLEEVNWFEHYKATKSSSADGGYQLILLAKVIFSRR
jgi:hypothetical protein